MISTYTSPLTAIPSQMKTYKEKIANNRKWAKDTVDAYEQQGRRQFYKNLHMMENYQMLNGRFFMHHYFEEEGYKDWLTLLSREMEIPTNLKHYDIIGKIVNNLTEKLNEFPDVFRVQEFFEEDETNEYVRTQTRLMHDSIKAIIYAEIQNVLLSQGIDPNKQDFASEEEAMQYFEEVNQLKQALEPAQIQKYMLTEWQSQGEIWGTHELEVSKERFNLPELERKEFRDMLLVDRCYRHYYLTGDGYMQETWNPINTFHSISPEQEWVENGEFVGRMWYATKSEIINRYGWRMTKKDIEKLEKLDQDWTNKNDLTGFPYKVYAPFEDFKSYELITRHSGYDPINKLPVMSDEMLYELSANTPYVDRVNGLYRVTELYWMSQKKIGKVVYIDEESGLLTIDQVDDTFVVPEGFKEITGDFYTGKTPNTVYWTYVNEAWEGVKIAYSFAEDEGIYLGLKSCEFQFKGDFSPYNAKLPVCGRIFNARNSQSMSFVDMAKPHQIGYNVSMNQLYQLLEKEIGKFIVWDANFFNTMKDWGGEDSFEKVAIIARELGHVFGDTSPQAMKGANPGNQFPREVNMELTAQIFSRAKIAEFFENRLMGQLGISPQLMADVNATDTATGVRTAVTQSQLNVQKYYTDFFEYKKRTLTMTLDMAQYVQAKDKDVTISYTKSDASRVYIKLQGTNLLLRNMHVYVVNSQQLLRQLEMIRNLFVNNNTTNATALDLVEVLTSNSPSAIKAKLEESLKKQEAKEMQMMQQQQQSIDQQAKIAEEQMNREDARVMANNETKKEVAYIQSFNKQPNNLQDSDKSNTPDILEYSKLASANQSAQEANRIKEESNRLKQAKQTSDKELKARELDLKEQEIKQKAKESRDRVKIAKVNKN
jgi:hypothetical protein